MLLAGVVNAMKIGGATDELIDVVADTHTWMLLNSAHVIPRTLQCVFNLSGAIYLFFAEPSSGGHAANALLILLSRHVSIIHNFTNVCSLGFSVANLQEVEYDRWSKASFK